MDDLSAPKTRKFIDPANKLEISGMPLISPEVHRLEHVLARWHTESKAERSKIADRTADRIAQNLPRNAPTLGGSVDPVTARQIQSTVSSALVQELLPACTSWLAGERLWPEPMGASVREDARRILNNLPPISMPVVTTMQPVTIAASAMAALVGGVAGGALLPWPLSIGGLGAALCGAGLVWSLGHLAGAKPARALLEMLQPGGRSGLSADMLVLALRPPIEDRLLLAGELVLAGLWSHPDRLPEREGEEVPSPLPDEPVNLLLSIRLLEAALADQRRNAADEARLRELIDTSDEVVQFFVEDGYEWKTPLPDEHYTKDLEKLFRPFGQVGPEDRLVVMEPALLRNGKLIKAGCVRAA
jgi:hypothetical protein